MSEDLEKLRDVLDPGLFYVHQRGRDFVIRTWLQRPDGDYICLHGIRSGTKWIFATTLKDWAWAYSSASDTLRTNNVEQILFFLECEMVAAAAFFRLKIGPDRDGLMVLGVEDDQVADAIHRMSFGMLLFLERTLKDSESPYPEIDDLFL